MDKRHEEKHYTREKIVRFSSLDQGYQEFLKGNISHNQYKEFEQVYKKRQKTKEIAKEQEVKSKKDEDYDIIDNEDCKK